MEVKRTSYKNITVPEEVVFNLIKQYVADQTKEDWSTASVSRYKNRVFSTSSIYAEQTLYEVTQYDK